MSSAEPASKKSKASGAASRASPTLGSGTASTLATSPSAGKKSEAQPGSTLVPKASGAPSSNASERPSVTAPTTNQKPKQTGQPAAGLMAGGTLAKMTVLEKKTAEEKVSKKTFCGTGLEGFPPMTDYSAGEERELMERKMSSLEAGTEYTCRVAEKAAVNIMKPIHNWNEDEREASEDVIDYIEREALMVEKSPYDDEPPREIIGYVYVIPHPDTSLIDVALRPQAEELLKEDDRVSSSLSDISDPGIDEAFDEEGDFSKSSLDSVGEKHYRYMCEQLSVMPSAQFIKSLRTDTVSFRYYGLNPRAMRPITEALYNNVFVRYLDFSNNWLNEDSAFHLCELMRENNNIVFINLTGCRLGPVSAWKISEGMVNNRTVKELRLSGNEFGDLGAKALTRGLEENMTIYKLDLSYNELGREAGLLFGPILMDQFTIRELDLSWNKLYFKDGFKTLMTGLKQNIGLTYLNLAGNALNIDSAKALRPFLAKNESVKTLDLSFNRFTNVAMNILKKGMGKNHTLRYLKLGHNPITFEAPTNFVQTLKNPKCVLALLDLEDIWVNKECAQIEKEIAEERDFLVVKAGVIGNYVIKGPDVVALLLQRARYEGMLPKKKKKKKDFGVFLLKLPGKTVAPKKFNDLVKGEKLKIREELIEDIKLRFTNEKKKIDVAAMLTKYMELFPETRIPPKKKKKKKGKKGKKRKKGKKGEEKEGDKKGDEKKEDDKKGEEKKEGEPGKDDKSKDKAKDDKEGKEKEEEERIPHPSKIGMRKSKLVQLPKEIQGPLTKKEKEKVDMIPWDTMLPKRVPDPVYVPEITQMTQAREIEEAEMRRRASTQRASEAPIPSDKMQELLDREAEQERLKARAQQPAPVNKALDDLVGTAVLGKRISGVDTAVDDAVGKAVEGGKGGGTRGSRGRGSAAGRGAGSRASRGRGK